MGEIEPASDDASLSTVLVHRADGLAHRPLERNQPTAGITPAIAGVLINRSKEPDAGPHVRFCEKHGGVILRAYSTLDRRPALAGDGGFKIPWRGRPPFGVEGGIAAHSTNRMSLDAEPSCDRPPGDALHDPFPTTRPGIRCGHGRLQHAHCAPHR